MTQPLFAFWRYTNFPYLLGGTVTKLNDNGSVETLEYGPGNCFQAVKMLPLDAGKKLLSQLRDMQRERGKALNDLYIKWDKKLCVLLNDVDLNDCLGP
jgi:hypothetical protein